MKELIRRNFKVLFIIGLVLVILGIATSSFAASLNTKGLSKNDVLVFKGTAWNVYSSKTDAKNSNSKKATNAIQNGDKVTIKSIATDCDVLKVKVDGKKSFTGFILYGKNASQFFTKNGQNIAVKKITLNETSVTLGAKKSVQLKATLSPDNASSKKVTWTSSNKNIATVSSSGKVTAKSKSGEAIITAKAGDKEATCKVTVQTTTLAFKNKTETVDMSKTSTINMADKLKVTNGNIKDVKWTSSYEKAAKIDKNGVVTLIGPHKTTITATLNGATAKCKLIVTSNVEKITVSKVILDKTSVKSMKVGEVIQLTSTVNVTPNNSGNRTVKYTSSNPSIVSVDEYTGKVTALKASDKEVVITATSRVDSSKKATCKIKKVIQTVTEIKLKNSDIVVAEGNKKKIEVASINPSNAKDKTLIYSTNSKNISVNKKTGEIKGLKPGTATVTIASKDGGAKTTCNVTIVAKVQSITLNTTSAEIVKGDTLQLSANVVTGDGSKQKVTWSSSNNKIATVSSKGLVKGVGEGKVSITALAGDKKVICVVNVLKANLYSFNNITYVIAVNKEKLNSVLTTIYNKHIYQKGSNVLTERCGYVACYHIKLLLGKISENDATDNAAYDCTYGYTHKYKNTDEGRAAFYSRIKSNIDNGKPTRLKVDNNGNGSNLHYITIVGYKGNCSGYTDLLLLGSWSGELFTGYSGEASKGPYGLEIRY